MTYKQKAEEIVLEASRTTGFEKSGHNWWIVRAIAKNQVDAIVDALKTTTGHCELRKLDWQEVQSDLAFWDKVKTEIGKL